MAGEVLEDIGKAFLPKKFRPVISNYLKTAGVNHSPYALISYLFFVSLAIALFIDFYYVFPFMQEYLVDFSVASSNFIIGVTLFFATFIVMFSFMMFFFLSGHFFLDMRVYNRVRQIEDNLPEFLSLVSTNLKGGMNIDSAMWNSIKPKFGVLSQEITLISKKVMTGYDLSEALQELHDKYDSPELKRTLSLLVSEMDVGGKISKIIDDIVLQLKNTKKLKEKMVSSVLSYVIFIGAITMFITPFLFALSYNLVNFIHGFVGQLSGSIGTSSTMPGLLSNIDPDSIDPSNFLYFGYFALGTISLFSSMIVSIIQKGDVKGGLKFIPIFVTVSLLMYHLAVRLLFAVLGGLAL
ncbi:MAG: type II secretion system F family protein [Candidatus Woesearchaeota archaeon]